jgi:hypothetical protein
MPSPALPSIQPWFHELNVSNTENSPVSVCATALPTHMIKPVSTSSLLIILASPVSHAATWQSVCFLIFLLRFCRAPTDVAHRCTIRVRAPCETIGFPRLAQKAAGPSVLRSFAFVVCHVNRSLNSVLAVIAYAACTPIPG